MSLYFVIYVLSNVFLTYIIRKFIYLFFEKCRVKKLYEFLVYSLYFTLLTSTFLYFRSPLFNIIFNIFSIFFITFMYDYISFRKSIGITFIIYLILFSVEASIVILINFSRFYDITLDYHRNMISYIISSVLYAVLYNVMYIKKINFKKIDVIFSNRYSYFFIVLPFLSICLVIIGSMFLNNITFIIIFNLLILVLNIVLFKYYDFVLVMHRKFLSKILDDRLRSYKKDLKICGSVTDFKNCVDLNDTIIYEILNHKMSDLKDADIKLKVNISMEEVLHIDSNDLLVIIGNLIDNAISGVRSTLKNNEKYINIKIKNVKGTLIVSIKNSFDGRGIYYNNRFLKKNREFKNYGFGLMSVVNILEKYNGFLRAKFNKNNFEIYILLYDIKFM